MLDGFRSASSSTAWNSPEGAGSTAARLIGLLSPDCTTQRPWLPGVSFWSKVCQPFRLPVSPLRSRDSKSPLATSWALKELPPTWNEVTRTNGCDTTVREFGIDGLLRPPAMYGTALTKVPSPNPLSVSSVMVGLAGRSDQPPPPR